MSIRLLSKAWETPCKTHTEKIVLLKLADNANDEGICWPSLNYIARHCGLSRRAVMNRTRELEHKGMLRKHREDGKSTIYQLLFESGIVNPVDLSGERRSPQGVNAVPGGGERGAPVLVNAVPTNRKEEPSKNRMRACEASKMIFQSERFSKVWDDWIRHRLEIRHKLTPTTVSRQLKMLGELGEDKAIACIEQSISNGWQGLFPEKVRRDYDKQNTNSRRGSYAPGDRNRGTFNEGRAPLYANAPKVVRLK